MTSSTGELRYRLVIFDWDGTLVDSEARIVSCMQAAAEEIGWTPLSREAVRDIIGLGLPEAIARLCPGIDARRAEALRAGYARRFVAADQSPTPFFPGVEAGLGRLRRSPATRLAVATGKSRRGLDRALATTGAGGWFHATRTADETRSKPDPRMLEELLIETGVAASEALMIGDTEYDMAMARSLGMDRVAVTYGVHAPERLAQCEPTFTADDFAAVIDWLHG
ncbi:MULTISPECIES: HAD-IA family hydrolase [Modicisalibacter]|uniref:HAD-IA family hydrolase n=1 Tax=Modicisalibacter tunisiensis TaxID=390637 RepID=A0ABS7X1D1_9GAMM|nr:MULTISPECIES: HAD-IA family hydrolase [Modicisalibacter]MBZ9568693.1 HAD-IA family hydrolase [Modicisalibacter tunisiensis]